MSASLPRIQGFPPLLGDASRVLILGSVPSVASLEKHQYYGKPQNAFWRIMGELFAAGPELPYGERTRVLTAQGIAVWDVLASCIRPGSLDSAIHMASVQVNDFPSLFARAAGITHVFFNGRKAEELYRRRALPDVAGRWPELRYHALPSTSPAMAALSFEEKLSHWQAVREALR